MAVPVTIPRATISLEEGLILGWKKAAGSRVEKDDVLFEMETDKVVVEVPAPASGWLLRIDVDAGVAKVDQVVGWIGGADERLSEAGGGSDPVGPRREAGAVIARAAGEASSGSSSPAARRRARELGIDLANVRGSGPGGRITEKDVDAASAARPGVEESL